MQVGVFTHNETSWAVEAGYKARMSDPKKVHQPLILERPITDVVPNYIWAFFEDKVTFLGPFMNYVDAIYILYPAEFETTIPSDMRRKKVRLSRYYILIVYKTLK